MSKSVSEWAMCYDLTQCMGCKGFDKSEYMIWRKWNGTLMPYCTEECHRSDTE